MFSVSTVFPILIYFTKGRYIWLTMFQSTIKYCLHSYVVDLCYVLSNFICIVFFWTQDSLASNGYGFLRIDGTTKASDRLKIVNVCALPRILNVGFIIFWCFATCFSWLQDFQEGNGAPIFLLTSQVGGLGLTLTKADRVIVVDPAWNPR